MNYLGWSSSFFCRSGRLANSPRTNAPTAQAPVRVLMAWGALPSRLGGRFGAAAMAATYDGDFAARLEGGGHLRVRWHRAWSRVSENPKGTSGWVTVVAYEGPEPTPAVAGSKTRLHVCTLTPCGAVQHDLATLYGCFPPTIHGHLAPDYTGAPGAACGASRP